MSGSEHARYQCTDCGAPLKNPTEFHPVLFCLLIKNGIADPDAYLRTNGYRQWLAPDTCDKTPPHRKQRRTKLGMRWSR